MVQSVKHHLKQIKVCRNPGSVSPTSSIGWFTNHQLLKEGFIIVQKKPPFEMVATGGAKNTYGCWEFFFLNLRHPKSDRLGHSQNLEKRLESMKSPPEHLKEMFNCRMQGTSNAMFHWVFCLESNKATIFFSWIHQQGTPPMSRKIDERFNEESIPTIVTQLWTIGIVWVLKHIQET